jgi:putative peptidoglycan lipid II flippase
MSRRPLATGIAGAAGLIAALTLLARTAGFARVLVFAESVRAGGIGEIYQSVNALPNVVFEVAAGGTLAAVVVPVIAARIGAGDHERADHLTSVLLTWALVVLVPLGLVVFVAAAPLASVFIGDFDPRAREVATTLLRIFAVQVPLYGVAIVLTGLLHAHRRFLGAALAPLLSSVVVLVSYVWFGHLAGGRTMPSVVGDDAIAVLGWGTTLGVVVLSLPLLGPALATGWRWRPGLRLRSGEVSRIRTLAGAGMAALVAQQAAVLVTIWLTGRTGDRGAFPVYQYVQAVYLLPYAVLAVPVATSVFPALAARVGAETDPTDTVARAVRAVLVLTGLATAVLVAAAPALGRFFAILDAGRGPDGASTEALSALPSALVAYAPGLVGFGLVALLTRALYVRGHPLRAGLIAASGWVIAALPPLLLVDANTGVLATLRHLGAWSSVGMTAAAAGLLWEVRRTWGPAAVAGAGRTVGTLVVAVAVALIVGDLVTRGRGLDGVIETVLLGTGAGLAGLVAALLVLAVGDRQLVVDALHRGRRRRHRTGAP